MAEIESGPDPLGTDPHPQSLDERLRRAQAAESTRTGAGKRQQADPGADLGNRVLAELLGGMIGGAAIGFVLDKVFHTSPAFLLTLLFLGIGVAFRNIIRLSNRAK